MRTVALNFTDQDGDLVDNLKSTAKAILSDFVEGDTIQFAVTKFVPADPDEDAFAVYAVKPWSFTQIRASLGEIDKTPDVGTFKLKVGDVKTPTLTYPADLTADTVETWRGTVLDALNTIAGAGAARLDTPDNCPLNFLYFTWTSATDERAIEVVEAAFVPPIDVENAVRVLQPAPAFQQLVKLVKLPILVAKTFAFPNPPVPDISEERAGGTGVNAVQLIEVPTGAVGSFDLAWNGTHTRPLPVDATLTAALIADALNAIVANGDTNPSFAVTLRSKGKFAVEFIGPLAAAVQPLLVSTARDQSPIYTAYGKLRLAEEACERVLNGAALVPLTFELVIKDSDGETTILRPVNLVNDMTNDGTVQSIDEVGAVTVEERIVYLDQSQGDAYMEASPGLSFRSPAAGGTLVINHGLGTWRPGYRITRYEVDHAEFVAALGATPTDPDTIDAAITAAITGSHEVDTGITEHATSENSLTLTLTPALVDDPTDDLDYRLIRVDVMSPDASLKIFLAQVLWANCVDAPGGTSVATAIAALQSAVGSLGGNLTINASQIVGLLNASQINLAQVAGAIVTQSSFTTALQQLFTSNSNLITAIATQLATNQAFATTLSSILTTNTALFSTLSTQLSSSTDFLTKLQELVYNIIQGSGNLPDGATLFVLDDVILSIPAPQQIPGPGLTHLVPATVETTVTGGDTSSKVQRVEQQQETDPTFITIYPALAPAMPTWTDGGTVTGLLAAGDNNKKYTVASGGARSRGIRGRRGQVFATGATLACFNGFWFEVVEIGGVLYPKEYERTIAPIVVDDTELFAGSRFQADFPCFFKLDGNCMGRCEVVAEIGTYVATAPGANLASVTYTQIFSTPVHISPANKGRKFSVIVERAAGGTLTGTYKLQGQSASFTPPSANFALNFRLSKMDFDDNANPRGSFGFSMKGATVSIASLT